MCKADGGIGGIDVLAACTTGAHDVCADVGWVDVEIACWVIGAVLRGSGRIAFMFREAGEDEDGSSARVGSPQSFGRGHTLDAVDSGFAFKKVVGAWSGNFEDGFVDTGGGGFASGLSVEFDEGVVEGVPFAVGLVHAEEISDEETGFRAAGAGTNFEEAWEGGKGVRGNEAGLERVEVFGEVERRLFDLFLGDGAEFGIGGWIFQNLLKLFDRLGFVRLQEASDFLR